MRDALAHRGPDDAGIEVIGNVGLVHTRLSILDASNGGHQPLSDPRARWWLTYNGEIFNHRELRRDLDDPELRSHGDTDTLVQALAQWGPDTFARLNGQFAVAAYDVEGQRVLLARDRFGIKPLYVASTPEGVWFASEPQALVAAGVRVVARDDAWRNILNGSCYGGESTLLSPITRVVPGTYVSIALEDPEPVTQPWSPATHGVDDRRQNSLSKQPRRENVQLLEDALRGAVHDALMGDVKVGSFCSGGLDSSIIAALAVEKVPDLMAFGAHYRGDPSLDEGPAAQRCAEALGIDLDLYEVTAERWRSGFPAATISYGAPLANASAVTVAQLASNARRREVKVLLTGEGADELFAGYHELHRDLIDSFSTPSHRFARKIEPLLFGTSLRAVRRGTTRMPKSPVWSTLTTPEDSRQRKASVETYSGHTPARRDLEQHLLEHLDYTLPHLLNRMDKNAMQMGVETRVPYLDPRVVSLALNLPLEARTGPWSKGILRDVARRLLPLRVAQRPKIYGMSLDASGWIDDAAKPSFLSSGILCDALHITQTELEHALSGATRSLKVRIWSAEVWCRSTFGSQSLASIQQDLWRHGP